MRSKLSALILPPFLIGLFTATGIVFMPHHSQALSGSQFIPGRIMDDFVFTNKNALTVQQIQAFLNSKVPTCDYNGTQSSGRWDSADNRYYTRAEWGAAHGEPAPFVCLKDYYENTTTLANNLHFATIPGGGISAAQIIWNASQQYSINPEVLIVLIQKEQGIVTDDWPWTYEYRSAAGYGCPDSNVCNTQYYGLYNQINNAARQFRLYFNNPTNYNNLVGRTNNILYSPSSSCGTGPVVIENQATANLYNYTPYQPNAAALNNLYGSGDSCSSYGNRNFWRYFNDWFGTTYANDTNAPHPNGTLVHNQNGIFLINNNQISFFDYPQIIDSYHYNWNKIKLASTGDVQLPAGPDIDRLAPGTIFKEDNSATTYIMDYDTDNILKKRAVPDNIVHDLGYASSDIINVPSYVTANTPVFSTPMTTPVHPSGTIVLFYGIPVVYMIDHGTLRPFANELALSSNNYRMSMIKGGTQFDSWLPKGDPVQPRVGTMVLTNNGIVLIDQDAQGMVSRPVGPWECYSDRLHYTPSDWVTGYESALIPSRIGITFSC